ncbi:MAG: putative phage protein [Parcubacteria group bacterium GW2011_GWB1_36_5]|nr:MAG: putative phage protein [Parcubacteria group bacterium GW2011_GWB1_36_5]
MSQKSENRICQNCKKNFTIEPDDFRFYEKIKVPPPTFCPECRLIRRLTFRNERALYKRKCDLCQKDEILMFSSESPFKAYCFSCWWSDGWDGVAYGRDYDFNRPFFEQFKELLLTVPRPGNLKQGNIVNSQYTNRVSDLKNCYLCFGCNVNEDCMYGSFVNDSKECVDCLNVHKSERCYECIDCIGCYDLAFSQESRMCSSSAFLFNCRNCESCFGCVNLRSKSNHIFNQPYTKEEYQTKVRELKKDREQMAKEIAKLRADHCVSFAVYNQIEKSSGNWLDQTKNVQTGFSCRNVEDGKYLFALNDAKDVMDYCYWGRGTELIYETINLGRQCNNIKFANECWNSLLDSQYIMNCHNSSNLFGCIGLRNKEYCIFNKQYIKEEYEKLVPKIIKHMNEMPYEDKQGRVYKYGEFFPKELSPFAYNETMAQEYFPSNKQKILAEKLAWKEPFKRDYKITRKPETLPFFIEETTENILDKVIGCANDGTEDTMCTTAFRITSSEFNFYKKMNIPLPRFCPNCRHFARLNKKNPLKLWHRTCMCEKTNHFNHLDIRCPSEFETSYSPDRPEIVYCEKCYQQEVY